ncbi:MULTISPECIES: hypothetical protein [Clostridium]|uniref:Bacteriocin n=1 Tax=Clostridium cibarium TaxID=2762247 RepID=A0ABR8PRU5_9CLOT|nr:MULTISPECIES: hypothetical protein [Clostridium]MBD7910886.1 hypothetical protein [Clostridium cibarium]
MWASILKFAGKWGIRGIKWAWKHKGELISAGAAAYQIIQQALGNN